MYPRKSTRFRRSRRRKMPLIRRSYRRPIRRQRPKRKVRLSHPRRRKNRWKKSRPLIYRLGRPPYYRPKLRPHPKRIVVIRDSAPPPPIIIQRFNSRFSESARDALRSYNLYTRFWLNRLSDAPSQLINFIERYHHVSGFQHVVRIYFGNRYGKRQIRALLRLLRDLAVRDSRLYRRIKFRRGTSINEDGDVVRIALLHYRNRVYRVLPSGLIRVRRN